MSELERLAASAWEDARALADAEGEEPPTVVSITTRAADGTPLDVLIGRTCGRSFMAGTICSVFVDDDGEHDGPCA